MQKMRTPPRGLCVADAKIIDLALIYFARVLGVPVGQSDAAAVRVSPGPYLYGVR